MCGETARRRVRGQKRALEIATSVNRAGTVLVRRRNVGCSRNGWLEEVVKALCRRVGVGASNSGWVVLVEMARDRRERFALRSSLERPGVVGVGGVVEGEEN